MAKSVFRRAGIPIVAWVLGNLAWVIAIFMLNKFIEETAVLAVVSAIGFLLLILVGVVGTGWYFLRERQSPTTTASLEHMARWVTAMYIGQRYEVPPETLLGVGTPEAMEEKARRLQEEKELAKLRSREEP